MITSAKEAKAAGMSWLNLKWRHADGSSQELTGAFSLKHATDVFLVATRDDRAEPGAEVEKSTPVASTLGELPERFNKAEVADCEEALEELFKALPKSKQGAFVGHFNDLALFFQAAKMIAPEKKS